MGWVLRLSFCGWRGIRCAGMLSELARSDRRVGELCELAGRRQNLVSYHLRRLRDGGLVSMRRSLADGRDAYYILDLPRCGELVMSTGAALHPAWCRTRSRASDVGASALSTRSRACCFSAPATALARRSPRRSQQLSGGALEAVSAGSHPKPLHPNAVRVMRRPSSPHVSPSCSSASSTTDPLRR
jgi:DNA-binding transcriptional ArsR family regulator